MAATPYFTPATFAFLKDLARNNNRPWFQENKKRYEADVKEPALRFIADFAPHLEKVSSHFRADPRPVGGSLYRIHRDTRFSKDKRPYKTTAGVHFRHEAAKDAHAPGFYLHLEPGTVFLGVGIWHPDGSTLKLIRDAIVEDTTGWNRVANAKAFRSIFDLEGDSLKRAPKGYDPDHPAVDDLRRKDFIAVARLGRSDVTAPGFMKAFAALCRKAAPFNRYLCGAVGVPF